MLPKERKHADLMASPESISCGDGKGVTNTVTTGVQDDRLNRLLAAWERLPEERKQAILGLLGVCSDEMPYGEGHANSVSEYCGLLRVGWPTSPQVIVQLLSYPGPAARRRFGGPHQPWQQHPE